ncbi:MarR family transcriptional regulator [Streptomyces sp. NBC_01537]|uniref:MarR family winged helix-turn-helix transcriptional regulator n=1 Tax=Streptomyces sp. NBC_01537 TaxID=2903896 RepID=UPI0038675B55
MTAGDKVPPLRRDEQAVIRALLPAVAAMMRAFDADLNRAERMTHTEYLVLMFLSEAPECTSRLVDLAAQCHKSPSAISRAVGRLEVDGLVRRVQASDDGRGANAILTDVGLARLEQARYTHVLSIRRHLLDHLEGVDLDALARALDSIANPGNSVKAPTRATSGR